MCVCIGSTAVRFYPACFLGWLYTEANTNVSNGSVTQKLGIFAYATVKSSGDLTGADVYRSGASSLELTAFLCT